MNFYNNKLTAKKYISILKKNNKTFSKEFLIKNSGIIMGDKSFYRMLAMHDILKSLKKVKGDIVEFGVWNGNNLFAIKKIIDFLKSKKKIIGYDNFSGFPNPIGFNKKKNKKGIYVGKPKLINFIIKFFNFKRVSIINDDILNLKKYDRKFKKISLIYIDCNIYEPVKKILNNLHKKISKGGIIAFDEGQSNSKSGEGKALFEFYKENKGKYKIIKLIKGYQPDIILIKK